MEETKEIMANGEVMDPETNEEVENDAAAWPIIAGIGAVGMLMGIVAQKYVIAPIGAKIKAWRQSQKASKEASESPVIEAEVVETNKTK